MRTIIFAMSFVLACLYGAASYANDNAVIDSDKLTGKYSCSFTQYDADTTYAYPAFRCVIRNQEGNLELEKLSGSQRIKGKVTITSDGFNFDGVYFCPMGDCTANVIGDFKQLKAGVFEGTVYDPGKPDDITVVKLSKQK